MCIVCCIGWLHKKRTYHFDNNEVIELDSKINISSNPSYDITKQNRKQECQNYGYVMHDKLFRNSFQDDKQDAVKLDTNPAYGKVQEFEMSAYDSDNTTQPVFDVTIQLNPSYSSNLKPSRKITDDQYDYVNTDQCHSNDAEETGYLKIIGPTTKEEDAVYDVATDDGNVKINPNPSYNKMSDVVKLGNNPSYSNCINQLYL